MTSCANGWRRSRSSIVAVGVPRRTDVCPRTGDDATGENSRQKFKCAAVQSQHISLFGCCYGVRHPLVKYTDTREQSFD